jgi:hypothetical protein
MKLKYYAQWKTTLLGLVLILASIVSVFVKDVQWSDAVIGIGVGLVLVFSPDTILNKFGNFVKIAILIFMTSCMSQKKLAKTCAERFPINDSTVIIERVDTTYQYVQGDSIRVPFYVQGKVIYKDTICPPVKVANVSKVKEKQVYVENTAKIQHLENVNSKLTQDLNVSQQDVAKLEAKNKELAQFKRQVTFGGLLIIILLVLYKTRRLWL